MVIKYIGDVASKEASGWLVVSRLSFFQGPEEVGWIPASVLNLVPKQANITYAQVERGSVSQSYQCDRCGRSGLNSLSQLTQHQAGSQCRPAPTSGSVGCARIRLGSVAFIARAPLSAKTPSTRQLPRMSLISSRQEVTGGAS